LSAPKSRKASAAAVAADNNADAEATDVSRVHAWVYVHIVDAAFFIETTTGERRAVSDKRYRRINSMWNQVKSCFLRS
jgi:hypothetical protein